MTPQQSRREAQIATFSLVLTVILYGMLFDLLTHKVYDSYYFPHSGPFYGGLVYIGALLIVFYSIIHYHVCLIGNYKRNAYEVVPEFDEVATLYDNPAPTLVVLVPSFKEERQIILQTLLSAALSEYPAKDVVLLIDNPQNPKDASEIRLLEQARSMPRDLQQRFAEKATTFHTARDAYLQRRQSGQSHAAAELQTLSALYDDAAQWLEGDLQDFASDRKTDAAADRPFFIQTMLLKPASLHREQAAKLRAAASLSDLEITRHYHRLAGLFTVTFSSFERKRYSNLSHDPNKAMNLNSYISLIGRTWKEVETPHGLQLQECAVDEQGWTIPDVDYVNTIDADSLMTHDYVARLIYFLEQPHHARVAVAQSPCSATPGHRSAVERIASASIDVQFHTHQGYTYWDASFWVGANAMLRMDALEAIKEVQDIHGKTIAIYIQDRTLIEDTESTIDLVHKGWKLYNYPKRMTFSVSPGDFGSLLIQRRRWANGGLIILPKLLHYVLRSRKDLRLAREFFMRFNYLAMTSLSVAMLLVYCFFNFSPRLSTPLLIYATIPYMLLLARDLKICGYRYSDVLRVCAFNLMLLPVVAAGVLKQMEQIITGRKVPFGRTPKVEGRTGAPVLYYLLELALVAYFAKRVIEELDVEDWEQTVFAGVNLAFIVYALIVFVGIVPLFQDVGAALMRLFTFWRPRPTAKQ